MTRAAPVGWQAVVSAVDSLRDEIGTRHAENLATNAEQNSKLDEVIRRVDALHKGFPNSDPDGHRRAHEAMIAKAEARTKLYQDLTRDLATKGVYAVVIAVLTCCYWWMKEHIKALMG